MHDVRHSRALSQTAAMHSSSISDCIVQQFVFSPFLYSKFNVFSHDSTLLFVIIRISTIFEKISPERILFVKNLLLLSSQFIRIISKQIEFLYFVKTEYMLPDNRWNFFFPPNFISWIFLYHSKSLFCIIPTTFHFSNSFTSVLYDTSTIILSYPLYTLCALHLGSSY